MKILYYAGCVVCLTGAALGGDIPGGGASAADYLRAIRANDLKVLRQMSQAHLAEVRDGLDWTPLHYAALYGSPEAVRVVLEAGGDPNARNQAQVTPLMFGAYSFEKTRLLVEKGADVNAKAKDGTTPLWVAAGAQGNERTVRYRLDKGANIKEIRPSGADYLIRAAAHEDAGMTRLLLEKGLEPRRVTEDGDTSLTQSFSIREHEKAGILLAAGADANAANTDAGIVKNGPIDSFGVTPLMLAATMDDPAESRDLPDLHLRAMTHPAASGERFLAVAGDFMTIQEIALTLRARMSASAGRVPTRLLPDWMVRLTSLFDSSVALIVPN